jgi:hypothetical protein
VKTVNQFVAINQSASQDESHTTSVWHKLGTGRFHLASKLRFFSADYFVNLFFIFVAQSTYS